MVILNVIRIQIYIKKLKQTSTENSLFLSKLIVLNSIEKIQLPKPKKPHLNRVLLIKKRC